LLIFSEFSEEFLDKTASFLFRLTMISNTLLCLNLSLSLSVCVCKAEMNNYYHHALSPPKEAKTRGLLLLVRFGFLSSRVRRAGSLFFL
jgi:hypothetical protein